MADDNEYDDPDIVEQENELRDEIVQMKKFYSGSCHHPIARMDDGICLDCGEDFNL